MSDRLRHLVGTAKIPTNGRAGGNSGIGGFRGEADLVGPARQVRSTAVEGHQTPESIARLLDVLAENTVDHALSEMERVLVQLRADTARTAAMREVLRGTPARVLREAVRLRAVRPGTAQ